MSMVNNDNFYNNLLSQLHPTQEDLDSYNQMVQQWQNDNNSSSPPNNYIHQQLLQQLNPQQYQNTGNMDIGSSFPISNTLPQQQYPDIRGMNAGSSFPSDNTLPQQQYPDIRGMNAGSSFPSDNTLSQQNSQLPVSSQPPSLLQQMQQQKASGLIAHPLESAILQNALKMLPYLVSGGLKNAPVALAAGLGGSVNQYAMNMKANANAQNFQNMKMAIANNVPAEFQSKILPLINSAKNPADMETVMKTYSPYIGDLNAASNAIQNANNQTNQYNGYQNAQNLNTQNNKYMSNVMDIAKLGTPAQQISATNINGGNPQIPNINKNPIGPNVSISPQGIPSQAIGGGAWANPTQYDPQISASSKKYGIDPNLLRSVLKNESGFNANAKSPAGAMGIAQLMPSTAKGMGINPLDANQSIDGAAKILSNNLKKYNGDEKLALAAYNAGGGAVDKYGGIPPFQETQNYVKNVQATKSKYQNDHTPETAKAISIINHQKPQLTSIAGGVTQNNAIPPVPQTQQTSQAIPQGNFSPNGNLYNYLNNANNTSIEKGLENNSTTSVNAASNQLKNNINAATLPYDLGKSQQTINQGAATVAGTPSLISSRLASAQNQQQQATNANPNSQIGQLNAAYKQAQIDQANSQAYKNLNSSSNTSNKLSAAKSQENQTNVAYLGTQIQAMKQAMLDPNASHFQNGTIGNLAYHTAINANSLSPQDTLIDSIGSNLPMLAAITLDGTGKRMNAIELNNIKRGIPSVGDTDDQRTSKMNNLIRQVNAKYGLDIGTIQPNNIVNKLNNNSPQQNNNQQSLVSVKLPSGNIIRVTQNNLQKAISRGAKQI